MEVKYSETITHLRGNSGRIINVVSTLYDAFQIAKQNATMLPTHALIISYIEENEMLSSDC